MSNRNVRKLEWQQAPQSLLDYVRRYILPTLDEITIVSDRIKSIIKHPGFCYDIYEVLLDFYLDDWKTIAVMLTPDYEISSIVLARLSPIHQCEYRIEVDVNTPHEIYEIGSFSKGPLFKHEVFHHQELVTIANQYQLEMRYRDKMFKPSQQLPLTRVEDEEGQVLFALTHPRLFLRMFGPKSLFEYIKKQLLFDKFDLSHLPSRDDQRLHSKLNEYAFQLQGLDPHKWHIESIGLSADLSIDYVLLYHERNVNLRLVLNDVYDIVDIFNDRIIYPNLETVKDAETYQMVATHYRQLLSPDLDQVASDTTLANQIELEDDFQAFRDNFAHGKIVVIGPSHLSQKDMDEVGYELGLPSGVIAYDYPDFDKLTGTSFDHFKKNQDQYLGIILGPTPHKVKGLGHYRSLSSKFKDENGYPFLAEAMSLTRGKTLKITRYSFKAALFEIMRHHLALLTI